MATIHREVSLPLTADSLWELITQVGEVPKFLPMITECRLDGDRRLCTMADGSKLKETIVTNDSMRRRLAYTITEAPFPMEFHSASMQVVPDGAGARLIWITDIKPDGLVEGIAPLFDQAIESVRAKHS